MYSQLADPLARETGIRRDADGAIIPADPLNTDWQVFESWLAQGNTPVDAVGTSPPAPKPGRSS